MDSNKTILVSGCPRSGTSWTQFLLAAHPDVVTCRESHVYDKYLGPLKVWFDQEHKLKGAEGLSSLFSENEFIDEILAPIVKTTFARIGGDKESDQTVLEKTPGNILHHQLISKIQPEAKILFVVRDPRAVYASFKEASKEDWGSWTKKTPDQFGETWNRYITAFLAAKSYRSADRLMSVRYEDMKLDGSKWLAKICTWAGLDVTDDFVEQTLNDNKLEKLNSADSGYIQYDKRAKFYRQGKAYGWVDELELDEIRSIEANCLDLMTVMGYLRHTASSRDD